MKAKQKSFPLVSVVIPVYNEERYISECLQSLNDQLFKNFEIIVINDGSTDSSVQIASQFTKNIYSVNHGGPGKARNRGANIAHGKILLFLDADMYFSKTYIENIIKPIINNKSFVTFSTKEFVANPNNIWAKCWNINLGLPYTLRISTEDKTIGLAFRAILKNKFIEMGGYDPKLGYIDDRLLSKYNIKAFPVDNALCYHHNPDSLKDVFLSARWIGRSKDFIPSLSNIWKYSIINSIRMSNYKILNRAPLRFIIFKIIFDLGIFIGIMIKNTKHNYSK